MKIGGRTPALETREVVFQRSDGNHVRLKLTALPIGTDGKYNRELRQPTPPFKDWARDPQRGGFLYDGDGRLIPTYDDRDPKYRDALARRNQLWCIAMIAEALRGDADVEFEAKREGYKTTETWLEALHKEFCENSGLAMGELTELLDEVMTLSGLRKDETEAARADFSARGASNPAGSSPTTPDAPSSTGDTDSGSDSE